MKILAIDPGGTTGLAYADFEFKHTLPEIKTEMPGKFIGACARIDILLNPDSALQYRSYFDLVILERFTINMQTIKKSVAGSKMAIEISGLTRWLAYKYNVELEEQGPVDAKTFITDDKLRWLGCYTSGPDHARDATRHLLLAAVRHNVINPALLIPGRIKDL